MGTKPKSSTLLKHPSGVYARVGKGFSWPAFFFGSLWAFVKRAWLLTVLLLALEVALWAVGGYAATADNPALLTIFLLANVAYAVARGIYGNRWLLAMLRRRGFVPV